MAVAIPDSRYSASAPLRYDSDFVAVVQDDREYTSPADEYSLDLEISDGTTISETGYGSRQDDAVDSKGPVRFVYPNGGELHRINVLDAAGDYQLRSFSLPVAPAFPHPVPRFGLDSVAAVQPVQYTTMHHAFAES